MRMNRVVFQGEYRCPREVPIKIVLQVDGNAITGSINNMHEKCSDWQNATIKGLIDDQGNFIKTKFLHAVLPWGRLEDAYKIEGNILGEMTLKSKSRMFWKDKQFTLTKIESEGNNKNPSSNIKKDEELINPNIKKPREQKEKQLKDQKDITLEELKEKQLRELRELQERQNKELKLKEKRIKDIKDTQKKLKNNTDLMFN